MRINRRIKAGINEIIKKKWKMLFLMVYVICIWLIWTMGMEYVKGLNAHSFLHTNRWIFSLFMFEMSLIGIMISLMYLGGNNMECSKIEKKLAENGFVDKKGEPPMLLSKKKEKYGYIYEFYSSRLPLDEYKAKKGMIEVALECKINSIEYGKSVRYVIVKGFSKERELKEKIAWNDKILSEKDFILKLGVTCSGDESVDLSSTPHVLVGGGTGSGKSNLLKLILYQCIKKDASVIIGDFKGGVDYIGKWHEKATIITDEEEFFQKLLEVEENMKKRQTLFVKTTSTNIKEYNQISKVKMRRIVVACDEFAQVLTKKEKDKEKKDLHSKIELQIEKIASLGRAFGIHLVLSSQRPDSEVLDGKIKGNLGYKVCGRADSVLSKIIIDNTNAAEMISQEDVGLFVTNFNTFFKAYYLDDNCWKEE